MARRGHRPREKRRDGTTVRDLLARAAQLQHAGRLAEAEALCRRILEVRPEQPNALYLLAITSHQARREPRALALLQRVIELRPAFAHAHNAIGVLLREQGRAGAAVASYRRAIEIEPDLLPAHRGLVAALHDLGRDDEAEAAARAWVAQSPGSADAHGLLAVELHGRGRLEEALESHRRAVELQPDSAVARTNLGVTLHALGRLDEAAEAHERAVALDPRNARAQHNLGLVQMERNALADANRAFEAALSVDSHDASLHWDRALALLRAGRLREGWDEFEWRWRAPDFPSTERHSDHPRWDGSPLAGRRLLVWSEQGLGDTVQFARFLPMLAQRGARLVLECAPELRRLLRSLAGVEAVVARDESPGDFDVQLPLLSLPRIFGTTLDSVPAKVPYLSPDPADRERWKAELSAVNGFRVGLVWAGSATHRNDHARSIPPELLAPLFAVRGVCWFALQVGRRGDLPSGEVTDLAPKLHDFAETAAAIANLDLIVTVDTAVAHVAGAVGAPVWVLLPHAPDWRWLEEREDSPWYPTMRLFRQRERGRWESTIEHLAAQSLKRSIGS